MNLSGERRKECESDWCELRVAGTNIECTGKTCLASTDEEDIVGRVEGADEGE